MNTNHIRWLTNSAFVFGLFLGLICPAVAQTWTEQQQEVLVTLTQIRDAAANNDVDRVMSFFHDDFTGWGTVSLLPTDKEFRRKTIGSGTGSTKTLLHTFTPVAVRIFRDVAVVHHVTTTVLRDTVTGMETTRNIGWTDVLQRQGKGWVVIADHGHLYK